MSSMKKRNAFKTIYDFESDVKNIEYLEQQAEAARLQKQAVETAFRSHSVSVFVRDSEVQDYYKQPAISDLQLFTTSRNEEGKLLQKTLLDGSNDGYIDWTLPGHDISLAKEKGCGKFELDSGASLVTACSENKEHYIKAKRGHCWMLGCPNCFNDTALRNGARMEKKLVSYADILDRKGFVKPKLKHWVISPPQVKASIQVMTVKGFTSLWKEVIELLKFYGMSGGLGVFHPYRLQKKPDYEFGRDPVDNYYWKIGPHFHVIGYGYIDTDSFRKDYGYTVEEFNDEEKEVDDQRWLLKLIHSGEDIRSVRQTIGYLLTHAGLGHAEETFVVRKPKDYRGNIKKEVLEIQDRMDAAEDRYLDDMVENRFGSRKDNPFRAKELQRLSMSLYGALYVFEQNLKWRSLEQKHKDCMDFYGEEFPLMSFEEFTAELRYAHQAEHNAINDALFDLFIPERKFNLENFEYVGGAKYQYVACMNEHEDNTGETSLSYVNHWAEHLDQMDWESWTKRQYSKTFQVAREFGEIHSSKLRVVGSVKDKVQRMCPECGSPMGIFCGCLTKDGEPAVYKREIKVYAKSSEADWILLLYEANKDKLIAEGKNFLDFSLMIPQTSSAVSSGLEIYHQKLMIEKRAEFPLSKKLRNEFDAENEFDSTENEEVV
jgi:hypothetical protein